MKAFLKKYWWYLILWLLSIFNTFTHYYDGETTLMMIWLFLALVWPISIYLRYRKDQKKK